MRDTIRTRRAERQLRQERDSMTAVAVLAGAALLYQRHKRKSETTVLKRDLAAVQSRLTDHARTIASLQQTPRTGASEVMTTVPASNQADVLETTQKPMQLMTHPYDRAPQLYPPNEVVTTVKSPLQPVTDRIANVNIATNNYVEAAQLTTPEPTTVLGSEALLKPRVPDSFAVESDAFLRSAATERTLKTELPLPEAATLQSAESDMPSRPETLPLAAAGVLAITEKAPLAPGKVDVERRRIQTASGVTFNVLIPKTPEAEQQVKIFIRQLEAAQSDEALQRVLDSATAKQFMSQETMHYIREHWQAQRSERRTVGGSAVGAVQNQTAAGTYANGSLSYAPTTTTASHQATTSKDFATSKAREVAGQTVDILASHRALWSSVGIIIFMAIAFMLTR